MERLQKFRGRRGRQKRRGRSTNPFSFFAAPRIDADGRPSSDHHGGIHPPSLREVSLVSIACLACNGPGFRRDQAVCVYSLA